MSERKSYNAAHRAHIVRALQARGGSFEALHTLARWFDLTPVACALIAGEVGLLLTEGQCAEIRALYEGVREAEALTREKTTEVDLELLLGPPRKHTPEDLQPLVDSITRDIDNEILKILKADKAKQSLAAVPMAPLPIKTYGKPRG